MTDATNSTTPARHSYSLLSGPEQALLAALAPDLARIALATAYAAGFNDCREAARREADTAGEQDESDRLNTVSILERLARREREARVRPSEPSANTSRRTR